MMQQVESTNTTPNLKVFTEEERRELGHKWFELTEQGREEEAEKLALQFPILPELLQTMKESKGIGYVIASGLNLSRAVEKYGQEWLNR